MVTPVNTQTLARSLLRPAEWADTDNKSQPTAEDPQAVVVQISVEGARQAEAAAQVTSNAQQLQVQPAGDGGEQVAPQASTAAAAPQTAPASAGNVNVARGATPAGGQSPAAGVGGGAASTTASTSVSSQNYVPADTNQDGEVSPIEETAYEAKLAAEKQAQAEASAPRAAEADAAVKTYQAVNQLGAAGA